MIRAAAVLIACAVALSAQPENSDIRELASRIGELSKREQPRAQIDTLLRAADLLRDSQPSLSAGFRNSALNVLTSRNDIELTPQVITRLRKLIPQNAESIIEAHRHKDGVEYADTPPDMVRPGDSWGSEKSAAAGALAQMRDSDPPRLEQAISRFLTAVEHAGDDPGDYELIAATVASTGLTTARDNASVRVRLDLNELEYLLNPTLTTLDGKVVHLNDYRGRVVLVSFWATWCEPCRAEMAVLETVYERWSPKGLVVLAVSDESPGVIRSYLMRNPCAVPVLIDAGHKLSDHYGVAKLPTTKILDRNGALTAGLRDLSDPRLVTVLRDAGL